jgi:hypothetical protein
LVSGLTCELGAERALCAAVAVTERVQRVEIAQEFGETVDELGSIEVAEEVARGEPAEQVVGEGFDVLR